MGDVARFDVMVPGPPVPCEWARKGRHGWYTPDATTGYRERIIAAWVADGRPSLGDAPVTVSAVFYVPRPASHFGTGRNARVVRPSRAGALPPGDVDNYVKTVLDALNGLAWADDAQVVCLSGVSKRWAGPRGPRTALSAWRAYVRDWEAA